MLVRINLCALSFCAILCFSLIPANYRQSSSMEAPTPAPTTLYDQPSVPHAVALLSAALSAGSAISVIGSVMDASPTATVVTNAQTYSVVPYRAWVLLQQTFPDNTYVMSRIAFCESRFVDDVVGEGKYIGWFQIDPAWLQNADVIARVGVRDASALFDPAVNVAVAAVLAAKRPDLGDWPVTRHGCPSWNG